ncbi:MAG: methylated-DNA--[protein]-cysteine S-methyltransferase [Clostridia bacterium]|nr:methylated-DNA--[protein]-cysteine S-methyltransferase [Clostridia bacterium]
MVKSAVFETGIGFITLSEEDGVLVRAEFGKGAESGRTSFLEKCAGEIEEYLAGERKSFDVPYLLMGTEFQKKVWAALEKIPYGVTRSYSEIAEEIGCGKAVRAVGGACGKNPVAIIVPCHRVVGKSGALTGFAGGPEIKKKLLEAEGIV